MEENTDSNKKVLDEKKISTKKNIASKNNARLKSLLSSYDSMDSSYKRLNNDLSINKSNIARNEKDLKKLFPIGLCNKLHLQIIFYGREYCTARGCNGTICNLCKELYPNRNKPIICKKA